MNFQQYLNKEGYQREDFLVRLANSLELDRTRYDKMESAYNAIYKVLEADEEFFSKVDIKVYPQGSVSIGTTTKPLGKDEFDLDIVVQIEDLFHNYKAEEIYNHLIRVLSSNDTYKSKLQKKNRCARINYAGDFHMDILPGCLIIIGKDKLMVPDRLLKAWTSSYPKGYSEWLNNRANSVKASLLEKAFTNYRLVEAKAEQENLPNEELYSKKPLKRAIQLTKRYRDIFFADKPKYRTSSIILTTLFGQLYNGETTVYDTIENILNKIHSDYRDYQKLYENQNIRKRIKVLNPVNPEEDFTDKWDTDHKFYTNFIDFIKSFKSLWNQLKNGNFGVAEDLFGSNRTKTIIAEQMKKWAPEKSLEKAGLTILSGRSSVDRLGNVSENDGYASKKHRSFGGAELKPFSKKIIPLGIDGNIASIIQAYYIKKNFSWLNVSVKDGKVLGKGKLKPTGLSKTYEILIYYDPLSKGRKDRIYIVNDKSIKFNAVPHLYPDDSLCLYHPSDIPDYDNFNFVDLVPWISEWLVMLELWKKYGVWLADEVKH